MVSKEAGAIIVLTVLALLLAGCAAPPTPPAPPKTSAVAAPTLAAKQESTPVGKPTAAATRETTPLAPAGATTVAKPTTAPSPSPAPVAAETTAQWFGQAAFLLTSSGGTKVLIDPFGAQVGYTVPTLKGVDAVTVSHEHADHNNVAMAGDGAAAIRGLADREWANIDQTVKGVKIRTVGVFHDNKEGAERGKNAVFVFEVDGMKVVHVGDLGHELTPAQVSAIGPVDVLMVPVGGFYTMDAATATKVMGQLSAKAIVPMHYRTPKFSPNNAMTGVDDFLKDKKVERLNSTIFKFTKAALPAAATGFVLNYE